MFSDFSINFTNRVNTNSIRIFKVFITYIITAMIKIYIIRGFESTRALEIYINSTYIYIYIYIYVCIYILTNYFFCNHYYVVLSTHVIDLLYIHVLCYWIPSNTSTISSTTIEKKFALYSHKLHNQYLLLVCFVQQ